MALVANSSKAAVSIRLPERLRSSTGATTERLEKNRVINAIPALVIWLPDRSSCFNVRLYDNARAISSAVLSPIELSKLGVEIVSKTRHLTSGSIHLTPERTFQVKFQCCGVLTTKPSN